MGWKWKLGTELQGYPQGFEMGKGTGDEHGAGGVGDVIPTRISCTKGWEEVHWEKLEEWEAGHREGACRERGGSEQCQGFRDAPAQRAGLQLRWIIEWENGIPLQ